MSIHEVADRDVAACGPASFIYDVRNTVAECARDIADGYGKCREVYLHAEAYEYVVP